MMKKNDDTYDINSGKHYSDMEYIRLRPRFYLGNQVYLTAVREVTDNAFDEIIKGYATTITVTFHKDGSISVLDDGRGVPAEGEREGMNGIVFFLGQPRAGSNFDNASTASAGTNGIGVSATNAISRRMDVTVWRDGKEFHQSFKEGQPGMFAGKTFDADAPFTPTSGGELTPTPTRHPNGTQVRFLLDETVEPDDELDNRNVVFRLETMCYLTPGSHVNIIVEDEELSGVESAQLGGGWGVDKVFTHLYPTLGKHAAPQIVSGETTYRSNNVDIPVKIEVGFLPTASGEVHSFVNGIYTPDGGSHHTGAIKGVCDALEERVKKLRSLPLKKGESAPQGDYFGDCAAIVISVHTPSAPYTGQDKLNTKSVPLANAVRSEVARIMGVWCAQSANTSMVTDWAKLALDSARETEALQLIKKRTKKTAATQKLGENLRMPEKLLPSQVSGAGSGAELFICEGDSAASALKAARDAKFQAIFPIRGKILNTYNMAVSKALQNKEISDIMTILGAGIGKEFNVDTMRYDRIILAADADFDGFHICSLLILLMNTLCKGAIEAGKVFVAQPPLFIVTKGKEKIYCLNDAERDRAIKKIGSGAKVSREKGLGETDSESLNDTIMNPETRILIQVKNDVNTARGYSWETFFGKDTESRKEWLSSLEGLEHDNAAF